MSSYTPEAIEKRAQEVLWKAAATTVPIDVDKVAESLGARIHRDALENQLSGLLIIKGHERHVLVNAAHPIARQRFTIGHELGHLILHERAGDQVFIDAQMRVYRRDDVPGSVRYTSPDSQTTPQQEREANLFASALLMPLPMLKEAARTLDLADEVGVAELANRFRVSEQAMSIRLQQCGLVTL